MKVGSYERSPERHGQANGYKRETATTRVGEVTLDAPQVQDRSFNSRVQQEEMRRNESHRAGYQFSQNYEADQISRLIPIYPLLDQIKVRRY